MAVSFPDGRPSLVVSWEENIKFEDLQSAIDEHFNQLAFNIGTTCDVQQLQSRQALVSMGLAAREVLHTMVTLGNTSVLFRNKQIRLFIDIPNADLDISVPMEQGPDNFTTPKGPTTRVQQGNLNLEEVYIDISLEDNVAQLLQPNENILNYIMEAKFGCLAILCLENTETKTETSTANQSVKESISHALPPGVWYRKYLPEGVTVAVVIDDLTRYKVDAVVNAANESLRHAGGLANALARTAGRQIELECNDIIKRQGKVQTGTAVVTTSGRLPCKKVIHAVGPVWKNYSPAENDTLLSNAIRNSLNQANINKMTSIAIPAVSSGLFGFPLKRCAEVIVRTIETFYKTIKTTDTLKDIRLVNFDDLTVTAMKNACINILGEMNELKSSSAIFLTRDNVRIYKLNIRIKRENIEDQRCDVIVNSISKNLNLESGTISKAIQKKAGPELEKEISRIIKTNLLPLGKVVKTPGFQLNCKYLYHAVCYEQAKALPEMILQKIVGSCLELADRDDLSSIAFPAIGSSSLPKAKVAKIFVDEVVSFAEQNRNTKLNDVFFVLQTTETEIYEAFLQEISIVKRLTQGISEPSTAAETLGGPNLKTTKRNENKTYLSLRAKDYPTLECAKHWFTKNILEPQGHFIINNQNICYITVQEYAALSNIKTEYAIDIAGKITDSGVQIVLNGPRLMVLNAILNIEKMLCEVQEKNTKKREAELLQSLVYWVFKDGGNIIEYDAEVNFALEKAFLDKEPIVSVEMNGTKHTVNLLQGTASRDKKRSVKVERHYKGHEDYVNSVPSNWVTITGLNFQNVLIDPSTHEFNKTKKEFSNAGFNIVEIESIQNPVLWNCYIRKKEIGQTKPPGNDTRVVSLYHRSPAHLWRVICRNGFQRIYSKQSERKYGEGIYFSTNVRNVLRGHSEISDEEKIIYIFEADVFVGKYAQGSQSLLLPPTRKSETFELFDSVVDDKRLPKTYVIFNSSQAYPKYLIKCERK
ncbi:protein mono-ADP-ribosyltransferase PARP9 [Callorhinchus milii]|uniref:protein mono-ADP-ribosyltransferase PARP9 n=1 Tax=Callorhinchus milii TaxID=7868 RepID=UPI0004574B8F|nr:protein mono-ADP-ribosyltransferase PARP9 [Callorhinchus milii]|eukprot:gi/632969727/ref/XP_007901240.1/ PREDICTED: poly [ADP-ribose] polymerase 9 isoform X1 [Callorhinchus milii]